MKGHWGALHHSSASCLTAGSAHWGGQEGFKPFCHFQPVALGQKLLTLLGCWPELTPPPLGCSGDRCELQWQDKAWTWSWLTPGPCRVPSTDHLQGQGGNAVRQNQGQPGEPQLLTRILKIKQTELYKSLIMVERCLIAAVNIERNKCMKQKCKGTGHCRANWGICVNHPKRFPAPPPFSGSRGQVMLQAPLTHRSHFRPWGTPEDWTLLFWGHVPVFCTLFFTFWAFASCRSNSWHSNSAKNSIPTKEVLLPALECWRTAKNCSLQYCILLEKS